MRAPPSTCDLAGTARPVVTGPERPGRKECPVRRNRGDVSSRRGLETSGHELGRDAPKLEAGPEPNPSRKGGQRAPDQSGEETAVCTPKPRLVCQQQCTSFPVAAASDKSLMR